jgi:hypothetical protein
MGEGGAKVVSFTAGFMKPGIDFVKSWQGIVELILRGVVMVSTSLVR